MTNNTTHPLTMKRQQPPTVAFDDALYDVFDETKVKVIETPTENNNHRKGKQTSYTCDIDMSSTYPCIYA